MMLLTQSTYMWFTECQQIKVTQNFVVMGSKYLRLQKRDKKHRYHISLLDKYHLTKHEKHQSLVVILCKADFIPDLPILLSKNGVFSLLQTFTHKCRSFFLLRFL